MICWHLIGPPSTSDFLGEVGSNLALGMPVYVLLQL